MAQGFNINELGNPEYGPIGFAVKGDSRRFTKDNTLMGMGSGGLYFNTYNDMHSYMANSPYQTSNGKNFRWSYLDQYMFSGAYAKDVDKTYYAVTQTGARQLGLYDQIEQGAATEQAAYATQQQAAQAAAEEKKIADAKAAQIAGDNAYIASRSTTGIQTERSTLSSKSKRGGVSGLSISSEAQLGGNTLLGAQ